jgi:hypothetical protein
MLKSMTGGNIIIWDRFLQTNAKRFSAFQSWWSIEKALRTHGAAMEAEVTHINRTRCGVVDLNELDAISEDILRTRET